MKPLHAILLVAIAAMVVACLIALWSVSYPRSYEQDPQGHWYRVRPDILRVVPAQAPSKAKA